MGNRKPLYEPGREQSAFNGHHPKFNPHNWRDSITMERPKTTSKRGNLILNLLDLILYVMLLLNVFPEIHSIGEAAIYISVVLYSMARTGIYLIKFIRAAYRSWNLIKKFCKELMRIKE